jgi:hypothetical protein
MREKPPKQYTEQDGETAHKDEGFQKLLARLAYVLRIEADEQAAVDRLRDAATMVLDTADIVVPDCEMTELRAVAQLLRDETQHAVGILEREEHLAARTVMAR